MKRLVIFQTVTPDYRKKFYQRLSFLKEGRLVVYAGDECFQKSVMSDKSIDKKKVVNAYFFNRKLLFQFGNMWVELFKNSTLVVGLNPRIISSWIFLAIRKALGLDTYVWGHAWSRKGIGSKSNYLRFVMQKLATGTIVYTKSQKKELKSRHPKLKVYSAPNALYLKEEMSVQMYSKELTKDIIYVGRLTKQKKAFFLVKTFHKNIHQFPQETKLILVGDGPMWENIKGYILKYNLSKRILLKGHLSDYKLLRGLYAKALFSVSPGYVGLSITQSFAFGVPMLISKYENHSPEIEVAKENENAIFFETDNAADFVLKARMIFENSAEFNQKRSTIALMCKQEYSVEKMANTFTKI
jgi:glycosyltransferase involved in cell wall biosynthesis